MGNDDQSIRHTMNKAEIPADRATGDQFTAARIGDDERVRLRPQPDRRRSVIAMPPYRERRAANK